MPSTASRLRHSRQMGNGHLWHRRRIVCALVTCGLLATPTVHAEDIETGMAVGPSTAWVHWAGGNHLMMGGDFTLAYEFLWASMGARANVDGPRFVVPYVEVGGWFLANTGLGYSIAFRPGGRTHFVHGFLGVPVPVPGLECGLILEPYYRPSLLISGGPFSVGHEAGLLIKLWAWESRGGRFGIHCPRFSY
jgi:hypothetical protein